MARKPRVFVEGGTYHVYNRIASGEAVFADPEWALELIDLLRLVKKRDGWTVFAWCVMSKHYHLTIRSSAVPISRGMHTLQGRFSKRFNRSRRRTGALWQSRYHARPINEGAYLDRVVLYIHLNPVRAGLAPHPTEYVFGGHREIARKVADPVVDIDQTLLCFGHKERTARRAYLSAIRRGCRDVAGDDSGPPLLDRVWAPHGRDLTPEDPGPYVDVLGRSTGAERLPISAGDFVSRCASVLDVDLDDLRGRGRMTPTVEARRVIVALGRERWRQSTKELAAALAKSEDVVSYLTREGVRQRLEDEDFARMYEELDEKLIELGTLRSQ
jgi:REP element-mobilizing transposase RayT